VKCHFGCLKPALDRGSEIGLPVMRRVPALHRKCNRHTNLPNTEVLGQSPPRSGKAPVPGTLPEVGML
jgi:hypothetical protein